MLGSCQDGLVSLFCGADTFRNFGVVFCGCLGLVGMLDCCWPFFLCCCCCFRAVMRQNSSVVFLVFLLLWFALCCFFGPGLHFLSLICLELVFDWWLFSPDVLCFPCVLFAFFSSFNMQNWCVVMCMFAGLPLAFCYPRSGLFLAPFTLYFFCLFLLGIFDL